MNFSAEMLTWLNDSLKFAGWVLAILAGLSLAGQWFTGRELERRRASETKALRTQVETSQKNVAEARAAAEVLRRRLAPRDVAPERRQQMVDILRKKPGPVQVVYPADAEARTFAMRLEAILKEAGWETKMEGAISFGPVIAFYLSVRDTLKPPARAAVLRSALSVGLGEDVGLRENKTLGEDDLQLNVSHRPAE